MRFPKSLRWRIAFAYAILIIVALGIVSAYLVGFVRGTYVSELELRVEHEALLTADRVADLVFADADALEDLVLRTNEAVKARVTIIDPSGVVLADSHESPTVMENHADRPEVTGALASGIGRDTRVSATIGEQLLYTAVPITVEGDWVGVARVAVSASDVDRNLNRIVWTVALAGLAVTVAAVALGVWIARRTLRSVSSVAEGAMLLAEGDFSHRVAAAAADTDETKLLTEAFNRMADTVQTTIADLRDEHTKLSALLDTMGDGVVLIASSGVIDLINSTARRLLRVGEPGTAGNARVRDPDLLALARLAIGEGERQQRDVELVPGPRYVSAIATPLEDGQVLLTLHDLTDVRQLNVTRREFVSNVSHELRNPLASITAIIETLEGGAAADPKAAADFLARVRGDIERMTALVNDLLTLSRIESGRDERQDSRVAIAELLEDARRAIVTRTGPTAQLVVESYGVPVTQADPRRLRQVVDNLLDNAMRFTPVDGTVTLRAWADGDMVHLTVSDTGAGIAPVHIPHLFERFYKADMSRHDPGTGLGLAIARHIVERYGGQIVVRSELGEGSTFEVTLPFAS